MPWLLEGAHKLLFAKKLIYLTGVDPMIRAHKLQLRTVTELLLYAVPIT